MRQRTERKALVSRLDQDGERKFWVEVADILYKDKFIMFDIEVLDTKWGKNLLAAAKEAGAPVAVWMEQSKWMQGNSWQKFFKITKESEIAFSFYKNDFFSCRFWAVADICSAYWLESNVLDNSFVLTEYGGNKAKLQKKFNRFLLKNY